jgi:DNA-binding transcriptional ArsR family regulator
LSQRPTIDAVLVALADPTRRRIVEMLSDGRAMTISDITDHFDMSRQAVTKHLGVLHDARVVGWKRRGRERLNRLQGKSLHSLAEWTRSYATFWDERLVALKDMVEREETK